MRLIVDIPDEEYKSYKYLLYVGMGSTAIKRIMDGKPYEERKVGKWITKSKRNPLCLAGKFFWRECSVCGWCRDDDSTANDTPFCPMCGAKMEEGD